MLRQQTITAWNSLKAKLLNFQQATLNPKEREFFQFLINKLLWESVLPNFPCNTDRNKLAHWTSANYQAKLYQEKEEVLTKTQAMGAINEQLNCLSSVYLDKLAMFEELTTGWKQEIDNNSGPTNEYVD